MAEWGMDSEMTKVTEAFDDGNEHCRFCGGALVSGHPEPAGHYSDCSGVTLAEAAVSELASADREATE